MEAGPYLKESLTFGLQFHRMTIPGKYVFSLLALLSLAACKQTKPPIAADKPVEVSDFMAFFRPAKLPYQFSDTVFKKKDPDSLLISYDVFTRFVPDTLLARVFGKNTEPELIPLARIGGPKNETCLFIKAVAGSRKTVFLACFDKKQKFMAGMSLFLSPAPSILQTVSMDKRYGITKTAVRKNPDGSTNEGKDVYVLNEATKDFTLIMTDPLDEKPGELMNPIDTLPRKNKLSADYTNGKMNLVSIRDGRKNDRITFFIHFENGNDCSGDIKGEAMLRSSTTAEYRANGDPCRLRFNFTASAVSIHEDEGCGSHRGLLCSFDGNFPRKKEVRVKNNKRKPVLRK